MLRRFAKHGCLYSGSTEMAASVGAGVRKRSRAQASEPEWLDFSLGSSPLVKYLLLLFLIQSHRTSTTLLGQIPVGMLFLIS